MTNATDAQPSETNEATLGVGNIADQLVKHLNNLSPRDSAESWYHEALEVMGVSEYYSETPTNREDPTYRSDVFVLDAPDGRAKIEYFPHRQAWVVTEVNRS